MIYCPRNHPQTEFNRQAYRHSKSGKPYTRCRLCVALRTRLKYRNDEAFREKEKARTLANYHAAGKNFQTKSQHDRRPSA